MKKLHIRTDAGWKMVFCESNGQVVKTDDKSKALPTKACWAQDDLNHFARKFGNNEFCLMVPSMPELQAA